MIRGKPYFRNYLKSKSNLKTRASSMLSRVRLHLKRFDSLPRKNASHDFNFAESFHACELILVVKTEL